MFQMPMSSPMMTTMLGFCCAAAGAPPNPTAVNVSSVSTTNQNLAPVPHGLPPCVSVSSLHHAAGDQNPSRTVHPAAANCCLATGESLPASRAIRGLPWRSGRFAKIAIGRIHAT